MAFLFMKTRLPNSSYRILPINLPCFEIYVSITDNERKFIMSDGKTQAVRYMLLCSKNSFRNKFLIYFSVILLFVIF